MVVKRGNQWCVIHAHKMNPNSETDEPPGSIIKCFRTKQEAENMHNAILASQAMEKEKE